ncbi:MAG TPA: YihY/virulence factor BrkB family protein [Dehalococcoidia bacterium]|nr:YihY/virulence factor BrkB family protein [Dehalococcoidia bacterium]
MAHDVTRRVFKHDDLGLSAEAAYHALLAFFPFLLFVGSVMAGLTWLIDKETLIEELAGQVEGTAPDDVSTTFQDVLDDLLSKGGLTVGIIAGVFALWSGSNAIGSLVKGLNRIHGSSRRVGMVEERLKGLAFLLVFLVAFILSQVLIVGSSYLADELGLLVGTFIELGAWITAFVVTAASVGLFYRWAPAERDEKNSAVITTGGLVFAVSWLTFMVVYTIYLTAFGGPTSALGIIGFVILLMVWFFWTAFSILLGAEVDHRLGQEVEG